MEVSHRRLRGFTHLALGVAVSKNRFYGRFRSNIRLERSNNARKIPISDRIFVRPINRDPVNRERNTSRR